MELSKGEAMENGNTASWPAPCDGDYPRIVQLLSKIESMKLQVGELQKVLDEALAVARKASSDFMHSEECPCYANEDNDGPADPDCICSTGQIDKVIAILMRSEKRKHEVCKGCGDVHCTCWAHEKSTEDLK